MNRRTTLAVVAACATLAMTAGCSSSPADPGPSEDPSALGESQGAVAMSFAGLDIQIWNDMLTFMEPKVTAAGFELLTDDPKWEIQTQVSDWESWIVRGDVRAIMGYPVQSDAMVAVSQKAQAAGIPVLGYASAWEGTSASVLIDNHGDGVTLGTAAGEWIIDAYGTDAAVPVALLGYRDTDLGRERTEGIIEGLEASGANVSISESSVVSLDDGYAAAQNELMAHPDTRVWLAMASDPALGAYQALTDAGVSPTDDTYLLGNVDATDDILDVVKVQDSFWRLCYILPARQLGEANADLLIAAASGQPLADVTITSTHVTPQNADSFYVANQ